MTFFSNQKIDLDTYEKRHLIKKGRAFSESLASRSAVAHNPAVRCFNRLKVKRSAQDVFVADKDISEEVIQTRFERIQLSQSKRESLFL